jgi:hypothetical protein
VALLTFLVLRPYEGIVHDARLYMGFAMAPLDPSGIGTDLLFQADGQSGYSIYPILLRALVRLTQVSTAGVIATAVGLLVWFGAALRLAAVLFGQSLGGVRTLVLVVLAVSLHTYYGGSNTFRFAEAFVSPRPLAEAFVLLGVAAAVEQRGKAAIGWLMAAIAMHPLMAAVGLVVSGAVWLDGTRWFARTLLFVVAVALLPLAGALAGIPGGRLTATFDDEWLRMLTAYDAVVFLRGWEPVDYARVVVHLSTLAVVWGMGDRRFQVLLKATLLAAVGGCLYTYVGADLVHHVFITQLQPWRVLWWLALLASFSLGIVVIGASHGERRASAIAYRRTAAALLVAAWSLLGLTPSAATLALLAVLLWWLPEWRPHLTIPPTVGRVAPVVLAVVTVVSVSADSWMVMRFFAGAPDGEAIRHWPNWLLAGVPRMVVALACIAALVATERPIPRVALPPVLLAAPLLAAWVLVADSRTRYQAAIESALSARIGRSAAAPALAGPVYWPDGDIDAWAFTGTAGYGSILQGIPRVFSRPLAIEWGARRALLEAADGDSVRGGHAVRMSAVARSSEAFAALCRAPNAPATVLLPAAPTWAVRLDTLVLPAPQLVLPASVGQPWERRRQLVILSCRGNHG